MRIVSLVPSWTETLVKAGVNVVGRTRFCIHPKEVVGKIPIVGGTKDWDLKHIQRLKPDLLILDREENPKFMAEANIPFWASHILSVQDVELNLRNLIESAGLEANAVLGLEIIAERWRRILLRKPQVRAVESLPGILEWGVKPQRPIERVLYIIWKNPWMCVSSDTFIGSMLGRLGLEKRLTKFSVKYPEFDLAKWSDSETLLLFSSEPYPFLKKKSELSGLKTPHAFVDGECFSWFGLRSLEFLEGID